MIEAYGVKGMKSKAWRKTFKTVEALNAWVEKNDAEVHATSEEPKLNKPTKQLVFDALDRALANGYDQRQKSPNDVVQDLAYCDSEIETLIEATPEADIESLQTAMEGYISEWQQTR